MAPGEWNIQSGEGELEEPVVEPVDVSPFDLLPQLRLASVYQVGKRQFFVVFRVFTRIPPLTVRF